MGCTCPDGPGCDNSGKHPIGPLVPHGLKDATSAAERIRGWWKQYPSASVAIASGPSDLVVLDSDGEGGRDSLLALIQMLGPQWPADVVESLTARGSHLYFKGNRGIASRNGVRPGLDIKAEGGYVLAPPSLHASGRRYVWEVSGEPAVVPVPPLPASLRTWLVEAQEGTRSSSGRRANQTATSPPISQGERNSALCRIAGAMRRVGATEFEILAALETANRERCRPPLGEGEVKRIAASISRYPPHGPSTEAAGDGQGHGNGTYSAQTSGSKPEVPEGTAGRMECRPRIESRKELSYEADDAELALLNDQSQELYSRGNVLVRPVIDAISRAPRIERISLHNLRDRIARSAEYGTYDNDGNWKQKLIPLHLPQTLESRGAWRFPNLRDVTEIPVFRPDGTIMCTPGYDATTGLLLVSSAGSTLCVPDQPTIDEACRAKDVLLGPFCDFPFEAEEKLKPRAAVLAALLSIVARPAINGPTPLTAVTGPTRGTGKGLLVETIALATTGRPVQVTPAPTNEEEWRKKILAIGLEGHAAVSLDNVDGVLSSPSLAAALTATEFCDRLLGVSRLVTVPMNSVWFATGNGMTFSSDLVRRVIPIYLDPQCDRPEDRTGFKYPALRSTVLHLRPRLIEAALTVLRAYWVAGRPAHGLPLLGSFEEWDRLVRGAVIWLGVGDPCAARARLRAESDVEHEGLVTALVAWRTIFGEDPATALDVFRHATNRETKEACEPILALTGTKAGPEPSAKAIGYALRRVRGRLAGGMKFLPLESKRNGYTQWVVEGEPTAEVGAEHVDVRESRRGKLRSVSFPVKSE